MHSIEHSIKIISEKYNLNVGNTPSAESLLLVLSTKDGVDVATWRIRSVFDDALAQMQEELSLIADWIVNEISPDNALTSTNERDPVVWRAAQTYQQIATMGHRISSDKVKKQQEGSLFMRSIQDSLQTISTKYGVRLDGSVLPLSPHLSLRSADGVHHICTWFTKTFDDPVAYIQEELSLIAGWVEQGLTPFQVPVTDMYSSIYRGALHTYESIVEHCESPEEIPFVSIVDSAFPCFHAARTKIGEVIDALEDIPMLGGQVSGEEKLLVELKAAHQRIRRNMEFARRFGNSFTPLELRQYLSLAAEGIGPSDPHTKRYLTSYLYFGWDSNDPHMKAGRPKVSLLSARGKAALEFLESEWPQ